jgi:phosphatidate cytidylyltransferase
MLLYRVLSGAVGIPLALFLIFQGGWWLTGAVGLLALVGFHEYATTLGKKQVQVIEVLGQVIGLALILLVHLVAQDPLLWSQLGPLGLFLCFALVMGGLLVYVFRYREGVAVLRDVSATVLGSLYVAVPFSFFVLLRGLAQVPPHDEDWILVASRRVDFGARLLGMVLLSTWATDTGAYFAGRFLGKKIGLGPLAPSASPNKTIEGSLGGLLAAVSVAALVGWGLRLPPSIFLVSGLLIGIAGQFGDLCKSILKRDAGVKDFGTLIPGHGGVLDRFDSLLMNVPLVYLYLWLTDLLRPGGPV